MSDEDTSLAFLHTVMVDEFGLPSNVLGVADERFFQLLGRLVPVSALLESHALDVYQTLRRAPQSEYTALGGLRLIGSIHDALTGCPESDDHQAVADFVRDAQPLVARRNLYVHSMMPAKQPGAVYAWRPNPYPKAGEDQTLAELVTTGDMQADLKAMLALIGTRQRSAVQTAATNLRPHVKPWTAK